jgi:hypothetical protein
MARRHWADIRAEHIDRFTFTWREIEFYDEFIRKLNKDLHERICDFDIEIAHQLQFLHKLCAISPQDYTYVELKDWRMLKTFDDLDLHQFRLDIMEYTSKMINEVEAKYATKNTERSDPDSGSRTAEGNM